MSDIIAPTKTNLNSLRLCTGTILTTRRSRQTTNTLIIGSWIMVHQGTGSHQAKVLCHLGHRAAEQGMSNLAYYFGGNLILQPDHY